ncbi:MAG: M20/M25/M40 family metallo-hydrolase [Gemmatimonadetes bacterium]|nr:M20/M25/M40 family metallo-hydrolase [Gemmatimonadota bacterium]
MRRLVIPAAALVSLGTWGGGAAQAQSLAPDWSRIEAETLEHYQALVRLDTSNPPGNETRAANYLRDVLEREGIAVEMFALDPERANLVARLPGSGARRPLLLMGHTDVVTVDPTRWTHPPFGAVREGGYVYGRGTLDDKDNLTASLMMMLTLKRLGVPLDREVIFLAEAGEEGTTRWGIDFMVAEHFDRIDAEFCLAEGGSVTRESSAVRYASIGTLEKIPRAVELIARGPAGHASVPLLTNPVARLSIAVGAVAQWQPPIRLNETTTEFFRRVGPISPPNDARSVADLLSGQPARVDAAIRYFQENVPGWAAILRTSASPTILQAGTRTNVIPSEARATIDVRLLPDDDPEEVLRQIREVVNDPAVEVRFVNPTGRPPGGSAIDTEAFRAIERAVSRHYQTVTLPSMGTGATDMAQLRAQRVQCYGIGPAIDREDGPLGFGSHSDQERILESELHRFVRFYWDIVNDLAARR